MLETIKQYWLQFLEACGFDGLSVYELPGMAFVLVAVLIVIYAFYKAVVTTLWPGEGGKDHIKYQVLIED